MPAGRTVPRGILVPVVPVEGLVEGRPAGRVHVVAHRHLGAVGVFLPDRVEDLVVLPVGVLQPLRVGDGAGHQLFIGELVHEPLVHFVELPVVRPADQGPVELADELCVAVGVPAGGGVVGFLDVALEDAELGDLSASGEQGGGEAFEALLELEQFNDLTAGRFVDEGADAGADVHQALHLEFLECLTHRGAADVELLRQGGLRDEDAGFEFSGEDPGAYLLAQGRLRLPVSGCLFRDLLHARECAITVSDMQEEGSTFLPCFLESYIFVRLRDFYVLALT